MKKQKLLPLMITLILALSLVPYFSSNYGTDKGLEFNDIIDLTDGNEVFPDIESILGEKFDFSTDKPDSISDKYDPRLEKWFSGEDLSIPLNTIDDKGTVMILAKTNDATLENTISPLGSFRFPGTDIIWIHTKIKNSDQFSKIVSNPDVIKVEGDYKFADNEISIDNLTPNRDSISLNGITPDAITSPVYSRELTGVNDIEQTFGYSGKNVVINVMDTGIDFGHSALVGTMALDKNNNSASFDAGGNSLALSSDFSEKYYRDLGQDLEADKFQSLQAVNGYIDTTNLDKLMIWDAAFRRLVPANDFGTSWLPQVLIPSQIYVGNIPTGSSGYKFGILSAFNGDFIVDFVDGNLIFEGLVLVPFVLSSSGGNNVFDTLNIDYDTAKLYSDMFNAKISSAEAFGLAQFNFTKFPPHTNVNNQYLSKDLLDGDRPGQDGFNDFSVGALATVLDSNNLTGRLGISDPLIRGIDPSGDSFGFYGADGITHGTSVAGEIAAQPLVYDFGNGGTINVTGIAPDSKILGTNLFVSSAGQIYNYLWTTGYEPDITLEWTFANDHIANITSNSWGSTRYERDGFVPKFDFVSAFLELITLPGYLRPSHPGILVVFSSGNEGPGYGTGGSPRPASGIFVGAMADFTWRDLDVLDFTFLKEDRGVPQGTGQVTQFSSSGPDPINSGGVDVVNIGYFDWSITATNNIPSYADGANESVVLFSGTSEAAPLTAASIAIMYEAYKDINGSMITPGQAKSLVKSTAVDMGFDAYRQGNGRVDVKRAVYQIVDGQLPNNEALFYVSTTQSYSNLGLRLERAFNFSFGSASDLNVTGYPGLQHPSLSQNFEENEIYAGKILAGASDTITVNVNGTVTTATAFDYTTSYSNVGNTLYTQNQEIQFYSLDTIFDKTNYQTADFIQVALNFNGTGAIDRKKSSDLPVILPGTYQDLNSDGLATDGEFAIYDLLAQNSMTVTFFISSNLTNQNAYIGIWDTGFNTATEDLQFFASIRAFTKQTSSVVSVVGIGGNKYNVTFAPPAVAVPGFYEGFVKFEGSNGGYALAPFKYSVPIEVGDYTGVGWKVVDQLVNKPYDNAVLGVVSDGSGQITGDWRYYDLELAGDLSMPNTIAIEVEWVNEGTVIDLYVFDDAGRTVTKSEIVFAGSRSVSQPNAGATIQRLLVNITDYQIGNTFDGDNLATGYSGFTIALHAVQISQVMKLIEPIIVRAAWVSNTVSSFNTPTPTLITTGIDTFDGLQVTSDFIGVEWSEVSTNPIPSFTTNNQEVVVEVGNLVSVNVEDTVLVSELIPYDDARIPPLIPERIYPVELQEGMKVDVTLDWAEDATDYDFLLIKKGDPYAFSSMVITGTATGGKPEIGRGTIPETGMYELVVEFFSGDTTKDQPFTLDFRAQTILADLSSNVNLNVNTSLIGGTFVDGVYGISSSITGWNFDNIFSAEFILDTGAPTADIFPSIPEKSIGNVKIGTVNDAVNYTYSISIGTTVLQSGTNVAGEISILVDSTLIPNIDEPVTFNFDANDANGKTVSNQFSVIRSDDTRPIITASSGDTVNADINELLNLNFVIDDATSGTYRVVINGNLDHTGTWVGGSSIDFSLTFDQFGSFIVLLELTDIFDNVGSFVFKVVVSEPSETTSSTTTGPIDSPTTTSDTKRRFLVLPIWIMFAGVAAIFIIKRRRRT